METTRILPDDIVEDILVRLPVKILLRWKCVCKHWYALFGDYDFTMKHYRFQYALHIAHHGTVPLFLDKPTDYPEPGQEPSEFFVLSKQGVDDVVLNVTPDFHRDIPPAFANDFEHNKRTIRCMGIVNGVLGLQWGQTCLALWNPATREFKDIPRWPVMPDNKMAEEFGSRILGLGFDLQSQDFKILGLIHFYGEAGIEPTVYEYHLYSLKSNSWKKLKGVPGFHLNVEFGAPNTCFNNGVYYWLADDRANNDYPLIFAFNFSKELFTQSELPNGINCRNIEHIGIVDGRRVWCGCLLWIKLGKYKETLALYITDTTDNSDCYVELWMVTKFREDDHRVLSWQFVFRVSSIPSLINLTSVRRFRDCGDLLLIIQHGNSFEEEKGYIYDPATRTLKDLGTIFSHAYDYVESLLSLARKSN